jgi:S-layer protein
MINVSGDVAINLGTIAGTNASVNASTLTKAITVVGEAGNNSITGGVAKDSITGGLGYDVMTGGAGADLFTIGLGATTTGSDAQLASTGTTLNTSFESITDYQSGVDLLNFLASDDSALSETIVQNAGAVAGTAAIDAEGIATFVSSDDTLAERIAAVVSGVVAGGSATAGQFAVFAHGSNTYIYVCDGTDAVAVGDILVELTGLTGVTTTTINDSGYLILS